MQRISRAPLLSATLSLDSCWIIPLPRLLHHVDQAPALGLGERPGLDHADHVTLAGLVALVVGVQLGRAADDLLVGAVTAGDVDADGDRFVSLAGDDDPLAHLGRVRLLLGRRGAGAGAALRLDGLALLATQVSADPPFLGAPGNPVLGAELRPSLTRTARLPQPPPLLPRKIVLRIRLCRRLFRNGSSLSSGRRLLSRRGLLSGRSLLSYLLGRLTALSLGGLCRGWRR